ncbi:merozoite TRAP-like protein, putative [Plasmodium ovale curtisi]|uniref:Merozoite TRAP-like protein, putative n=2 Tax=Plasmodium ovale curtisi TaxID=864141 RepID=A0A1A8VLU4_PLAOA|nr:merozoite TRAP-like protein, putative [Plasmodium ovale curtisi]
MKSVIVNIILVNAVLLLSEVKGDSLRKKCKEWGSWTKCVDGIITRNCLTDNTLREELPCKKCGGWGQWSPCKNGRRHRVVINCPFIKEKQDCSMDGENGKDKHKHTTIYFDTEGEKVVETSRDNNNNGVLSPENDIPVQGNSHHVNFIQESYTNKNKKKQRDTFSKVLNGMHEENANKNDFHETDPPPSNSTTSDTVSDVVADAMSETVADKATSSLTPPSETTYLSSETQHEGENAAVSKVGHETSHPEHGNEGNEGEQHDQNDTITSEGKQSIDEGTNTLKVHEDVNDSITALPSDSKRSKKFRNKEGEVNAHVTEPNESKDLYTENMNMNEFYEQQEFKDEHTSKGSGRKNKGSNSQFNHTYIASGIGLLLLLSGSAASYAMYNGKYNHLIDEAKPENFEVMFNDDVNKAKENKSAYEDEFWALDHKRIPTIILSHLTWFNDNRRNFSVQFDQYDNAKCDAGFVTRCKEKRCPHFTDEK